jgi:hypothetical protein
MDRGAFIMSSVFERQRQVRVPFSYLNGTMLELRTHEDSSSVHTRLWSQQYDPKLGPRELQPSIRSISVRLRLRSGAERSLVLTHVRLRARPGNCVTLIFPVSIEGTLNPAYDYAAGAAADYGANDYTWSTTHPEIHALPSQLPAEETDRFADSLASYLDGLCRRCLRLSAAYRTEDRPRSRQALGVRDDPMGRPSAIRQRANRTPGPEPAPTNTVAPVPQTALLRHAGISLLRRRSWVAPLRFATSPFSVVALPNLGDKAGGERFSKPKS